MQENKIAELLLKRLGLWESHAAIKARESLLVHAVRVRFLNFDSILSAIFAFFTCLSLFLMRIRADNLWMVQHLLA